MAYIIIFGEFVTIYARISYKQGGLSERIPAFVVAATYQLKESLCLRLVTHFDPTQAIPYNTTASSAFSA